MTPTAGEVAALLIGMLLGAGLLIGAQCMAVGAAVLRSPKGTQLSGEEFERNRRREAP